MDIAESDKIFRPSSSPLVTESLFRYRFD